MSGQETTNTHLQANAWRHPLKPIRLIDKSVYLSNLLLAHFYYAAAGSLPLTLDWNASSTRQLVDNNIAVVHSMTALQNHAQYLGKFIFSSLIFGRAMDCCVIGTGEACRTR
jgi:hypothetical protein